MHAGTVVTKEISGFDLIMSVFQCRERGGEKLLHNLLQIVLECLTWSEDTLCSVEISFLLLTS